MGKAGLWLKAVGGVDEEKGGLWLEARGGVGEKKGVGEGRSMVFV